MYLKSVLAMVPNENHYFVTWSADFTIWRNLSLTPFCPSHSLLPLSWLPYASCSRRSLIGPQLNCSSEIQVFWKVYSTLTGTISLIGWGLQSGFVMCDVVVCIYVCTLPLWNCPCQTVFKSLYHDVEVVMVYSCQNLLIRIRLYEFKIWYFQCHQVYTRLKKYTKDPNFNPDAVGKVSIACKCICSWVLAIDNYNSVYKVCTNIDIIFMHVNILNKTLYCI